MLGPVAATGLAGVVLVAAFAWAGVNAVRRDPVPRGGEASQGCAECHRGRVQATHDAAFVTLTHGAAAVADRPQCLGCHRTEQCRDCHVRQVPPWHTESVRDPGRDRRARQEHASAGLERGAGCLECHAEYFAAQCAECHRIEEWAP
ncbi:hypothetical protein L6Q96_07115 [Candidatus Binatia bacterium]|nr:hypothetical protein [Candidatus Binatia bacterium]